MHHLVNERRTPPPPGEHKGKVEFLPVSRELLGSSNSAAARFRYHGQSLKPWQHKFNNIICSMQAVVTFKQTVQIITVVNQCNNYNKQPYSFMLVSCSNHCYYRITRGKESRSFIAAKGNL